MFFFGRTLCRPRSVVRHKVLSPLRKKIVLHKNSVAAQNIFFRKLSRPGVLHKKSGAALKVFMGQRGTTLDQICGTTLIWSQKLYSTSWGLLCGWLPAVGAMLYKISTYSAATHSQEWTARSSRPSMMRCGAAGLCWEFAAAQEEARGREAFVLMVAASSYGCCECS